MAEGNPRKWALGQKLAAVALALGGLALFGEPDPGGTVTLDTQELAHIVESEVGHVTVGELADWIIRSRSDYRLIDIRDAAAFAEYHIPTAERVDMRELREYPIYRNERIVLYSDGGIHAAQAWFLLKAEGFAGAYVLLGGLDLWKDEILFPALPADASAEEQADFQRAQSVSEFFGGTPRTGGVEQPNTIRPATPKIELPPRSVVPKRSKKQKEGC